MQFQDLNIRLNPFLLFPTDIQAHFGVHWLHMNISTVNVLKFQTLYSMLFWLKFCSFVQPTLKMLGGMSNSVDPGSALFAYAILSDT